MDNPRHPHTCSIRRVSFSSQWEDGIETTVYAGPCRVYFNRSIRIYKENSVEKEDKAVSIPKPHARIQDGDIIDAWDAGGNQILFNQPISGGSQGNLGTTLFVSTSKN